MKKKIIFLSMLILISFIFLSACTLFGKNEASESDLPSVNHLVNLAELSNITGIDNYKYAEIEPGDNFIGERYWTEISAMLTIEFYIHDDGGMDLLEDYRTAANPQSQAWLESPNWETAVYYEIGDYHAEILALADDDCYAISFVPSAYPQWQARELAAALMELLIND